MKALIVAVMCLAGLAFVPFQGRSSETPPPAACHRCGMRISAVLPDGDGHRIETAAGEIWRECCPLCLVKDIAESPVEIREATLYSSVSGREIRLSRGSDGGFSSAPETALVLAGGSCMKNKVFIDDDERRRFAESAAWAREGKVVPLSLLYKKITDKTSAPERCAMCASELKPELEHAVLTEEGKRMIACCSHCGLFLEGKLGEKVRRSVVRDYNGRGFFDAGTMHYVVDNDLIACCVPSTMAFVSLHEAEAFRERHGGRILTRGEVLRDMDAILETAR